MKIQGKKKKSYPSDSLEKIKLKGVGVCCVLLYVFKIE